MQITWRDIAGLDEVITELKETVILPVQKRHLFLGSRLLQPPKGQRSFTCVLFYRVVSKAFYRGIKEGKERRKREGKI